MKQRRLPIISITSNCTEADYVSRGDRKPAVVGSQCELVDVICEPRYHRGSATYQWSCHQEILSAKESVDCFLQGPQMGVRRGAVAGPGAGESGITYGQRLKFHKHPLQ